MALLTGPRNVGPRGELTTNSLLNKHSTKLTPSDLLLYRAQCISQSSEKLLEIDGN